MCIPPLTGRKVRNPARLDEQRGDLRLLAFARLQLRLAVALGVAPGNFGLWRPGERGAWPPPCPENVAKSGPATHRQEVVSIARGSATP